MRALHVLTFLLLSINIIEPKKYLVDVDDDQVSDLEEIDKRLPIVWSQTTNYPPTPTLKDIYKYR